ncbi:mitochondrial carrier domain-containing protein [Gamsiella multidivaricata]|uniref:mitochondrial carrier domain-containing protein n=1 Tax=Gamsiella multidivaricata TaxID=101098 RepID=UPI002220ADDB|nr:mitochondrial carrier domain-containing protein [Gamsiella multidivaricata]KAI7829859.1 mitochondrial carrier domain-containing protein [Gamsiella multidivaricata]
MSVAPLQTETALAPTGVALYARFALAGAICCGVTHGSLTPVDVVKTRIQLDSKVYNKGMAGTFRQVIANEGAGALWTGFGPTFIGYSLQGGFKFGGYELWKKIIIDQIGTENATNNRTAVYLAASGVAEFIADIALCPLEATRIRLVSQPTFASGLVSGFRRIRTEEGIYRGFYSGFVPIVFKQVPYTMAKFVVFEHASERIIKRLGGPEKLSSTAMTGVNLGAGLIAGIAAAIVSQPADTLLSKINKAKGTGSAASRLAVLATELGFRGLFLGLGPRIVLVGVLTSLQFGIYGDLKKVFGATNGVEIRKI